MSAGDDPKTLGRARLSFANEEEIDEFVSMLSRFEKGEVSPNEWRAFRLVRGTYGQRQEGDWSMLRTKIPQGVLDARQLRALADVGERWSRGFGHITTRQNVQFHFVHLHDVEKAMRRLAEDGLTTREACGNSVRNITCCPWAGVAHDEPFDVTPYAEALTRYLLRHPLSSSLPRKFKIAFEGCAEDHAFTLINDLGFKAATREGVHGFRVTVGGGTAIKCTSGHLLHEFVPAAELFAIAEAVVRIFHRLGDREHRQRNRLKFLIAQLTWDGFRAEYEKERERMGAEGPLPPLPFDAKCPPSEEPISFERPHPPTLEEVASRLGQTPVTGPGLMPTPKSSLPTDEDFAHWRRTNVRPQKQQGYSTVVATVPLGDLTSAQMRILADLALAYADGQVRVTQEQDLLFRWVADADVRPLFDRLSAAGLGLADAGTVADVTSCPGAETCRLAVTQSRGLGQLLGEFLRARPDLVAAAPDVKIKISGCPNGCGLHHIAGIGFQGSMRKVGGKAVPQYFVMVGGSVGTDVASFGRIAAKIPARRLTAALERLLTLYVQERRGGESGTDFFRRVELARLKQLLGDLEALTPETASPDDYIDLAESKQFEHVVMDGECAA